MIELNYHQEFKVKEQMILGLLTPEEQKGECKIKHAVNQWIKRSSEAVQKVNEEINKMVSRAQDEVYEINVNHAYQDEKGLLQKNDKGEFLYTAENEIKANKERRKVQEKLLQEQSKLTIKFEPYLFTDQSRIDKIDQFRREELEGIFIPKQTKKK